MLTFPTRAKFVEAQLGSSVYASGLLYQLHTSMLLAKQNGNRSVNFKFPLVLENNSKHSEFKTLNDMLIEHLKSKKYTLKDISPKGFNLRIV